MIPDILAAALRGFAIGAGLIIAIGAQNAFILERGLARDNVLILCLICAVSDALLILAGIAGLGSLVAASPSLLQYVRIGGAAFLYAYAVFALVRAFRPAGLQTGTARKLPLKAAIATCLGLTFLNPHVYLDTVVLIGSLSAGYEDTALRAAYAGGAMTASFVWFFALGIGAAWLVPLFARPMAWRVLDLAIAAIMALLATRLLL